MVADKITVFSKKTFEENGIYVANAILLVKDDKHFAENGEAGILIDSISGVGKTKEEAESSLNMKLKERGVCDGE